MKSIVFSVLMFSMTLLFVGCENEGQPTQNTSDMEKQLLSKKSKPNKNPKSELITFEGDLTGDPVTQRVEGCCPNAGPFPKYTMTLSRVFGNISETYNGNIFMNTFGTGKNKEYIVQFWWDEMFLEVRGGVIDNDKKNKILTVTFTNAQCVIDGDTVWVNFTLTREPIR